MSEAMVGQSLWRRPRYVWPGTLDVEEFVILAETPKTLTVHEKDRHNRWRKQTIRKVELDSTWFRSKSEVATRLLGELDGAVEAATARVDGFDTWVEEQRRECIESLVTARKNRSDFAAANADLLAAAASPDAADGAQGDTG